MATAKLAASSLLQSVVQTGNVITSVLNTTSKSIGMLDAIVTKASAEQKKTHLAASKTFDERLAIDYAREVTTLKTDADEFCNKSARHAELFNAAYAEMSELLNPTPKSPE